MQTYLAGLVNGLTVPLQTNVLDCFITPPALQDMNGPHAYVWGGRVHVGRQTAPRGVAPASGFKSYPWKMSMWVVYESAATVAGQTNPTIDNEFPVILDTITNTLSAATMPLIVQDPTTEQYSQISMVAEEWDLDYPTARLPETMRLLWYAALFTIMIQEYVQQ